MTKTHFKLNGEYMKSRIYEDFIKRSWNFQPEKELDNSIFGYLQFCSVKGTKYSEREFNKLCKLTGAALRRLQKLVPDKRKELDNLYRRLPVVAWLEQLDCIYLEAMELTKKMVDG